MFGVLERLMFWLSRASRGDMDEIGGPLHPPAVYRDSTLPLFVPRADTPDVDGPAWIGFAGLRSVGDHRIDIISWSGIEEPLPAMFAPTVLLERPLSWEYPTTVSGLLDQLCQQGWGLDGILRLLKIAVLSAMEGAPAYLIIGTPMRGISGGPKQQHLEVWVLDQLAVGALRLSLLEASDNPEVREIGEKAKQIVADWAGFAKVGYAPVREDRPQVTQRRDAESALATLRDKTIAVWGCGAIGGWVAELLTRAGVSQIMLVDSSRVPPGVLVRQPYDDSDIGRPKATALAERLRRISPGLEVVPRVADVVALLDQPEWHEGFDIVIDATASIAVRSKLEQVRTCNGARPTLVSMIFGPSAKRALLAVSRPRASGAPGDILRRAKLEANRRPELGPFVEDFWTTGRPLFQPEPGCSDPTFRGSGAEVCALASAMLVALASELADEHDAAESSAFLVEGPWLGDARPPARLTWPADAVMRDGLSGYEVRVSAQASSEIRACMRRQSRTTGPNVETGGLMFGERDDAAKVVWVTEVIGPPPDSVHSAAEFVCGVQGVDSYRDEKAKRGLGSLKFIGMWHSHPGGAVAPSERDVLGMASIVLATSPPLPKSLLLIAGGDAESLSLGAYVFRRTDLEAEQALLMFNVTPTRVELRRDQPSIGLALSGGGSRAIAFHLGCMRALHDRGILNSIAAVSGISGGSVLAAAWAYSTDSFEAFDERIQSLLRGGLSGSIIRETFLGPNAVSTVATVATSGVAASAASVLRFALKSAEILRLVPKGLHRRIHSPLVRHASRTTGLQRALSKRVLAGALMSTVTRDGLGVILTACELRSGAAFRFGNRESGCWRYGRLADNDIPVAQAVAASAAYPLMLPCLDAEMEFIDRKTGSPMRRRVVLTDGGVYDNLGMTCFDPGRSSEFSFNAYKVDYIISCDAGQGLWSGDDIPYFWPSRVGTSFRAVFRKLQDSGRQRIHEWAATGQVKGFVMAYLGNQDGALPVIPADLISRNEVVDYPTDFSAMSDQSLEKLTSRGEQLTRVLIDHYCPEL